MTNSPRGEFIYVNDAGEVVAIRVNDWKAIYLENRARQLEVWREPFVHLRLPLLFNLRRDPFERAQHNSNTYHDWFIDRAYRARAAAGGGQQVSYDLKDIPPSQAPGDWSLDSLEKQIKAMTKPRSNPSSKATAGHPAVDRIRSKLLVLVSYTVSGPAAPAQYRIG